MENPGIWASFSVNGDLFNFKADSGPELAELVKGWAGSLDDIQTALADVKQGIVAKGIFTNAAGKGSSTPASTGAKSDGPPRCKHGEMKDLTSKNYKSTHYCPEKDRDSQCPPVNLR